MQRQFVGIKEDMSMRIEPLAIYQKNNHKILNVQDLENTFIGIYDGF